MNLCSDVRCSIYNDGGQKNDPNSDRLLQKHMCCQYSALCKMLNTILRKATRSFLDGLRNSQPQLQHHLQQPERSGCGHKRILRSSRSSHQWFKNYFWDIAKSHKSKTHRKPANVLSFGSTGSLLESAEVLVTPSAQQPPSPGHGAIKVVWLQNITTYYNYLVLSWNKDIITRRSCDF